MNVKLHDYDAEGEVLSGLIYNSQEIFNIEFLQGSDFYNPHHERIFNAIKELVFDDGVKVSLTLLSHKLETKKCLDLIGGNSFLVTMTTKYVGTSVIFNAKIVKDFSIRRKLLLAHKENERVIVDLSRETETVLAQTQGNIFKISSGEEKEEDGVKKIIDNLYDLRGQYLKKYEEGKIYLGYECGLEKIDDAIDGLRSEHLWTVGGWTSTGKTMFSLNILNNVLEQNVPSSVFSLEMSNTDLLARLIGIRTNISAMRVIKGKNDKGLNELIEKNIDTLSRAPLEIHSDCHDLEKIKMMIRRDVYTRGVKFVIIDYVQNISSEKYRTEYEIITRAVTELYSLGKELGITTMLISQVSNDAEKGMGAGAGFKGSGTIEAASDLAIRLIRDRKEEKPEDSAVPVRIIITKNRHGFTGVIEDYFLHLKSGLFHMNPVVSEGVDLTKMEVKNELAKISEKQQGGAIL